MEASTPTAQPIEPFSLNDKQKLANTTLINSASTDILHILLEGGSRSSKTFLHVRNIVVRALKAAKSRHAILRFRFNHVKNSIILDTFPKVMELAFPKVQYVLNKTDWFVKFSNGSEIWFGGLDDKDRTEKILGMEFVTIFLNECSQISNDSRILILTRLAQKVYQDNGSGGLVLLPPRAYYDCNPPSKGHWVYKVFHKKKDPESKQGFSNPEDYIFMKMDPMDNVDNVAPSYIKMLKNLPARAKKRFYYGEYSDDNPNQLFSDVNIDQNRITDGSIPDYVRVIVAVDPSGASDKEEQTNDAIGIVAVGLGTDGRAYVLEDNTLAAGPGTWGGVVTNTYERLNADMVVGEKNYGGEMVNFVIQTSRADTPFTFVNATRGKHIRASPIAALYEKGKVCHVGRFEDLEDELQGFSTTGYIGTGSPNRADALIWALTELFGAIVSSDYNNNDKEDDIEHYEEVESWESI